MPWRMPTPRGCEFDMEAVNTISLTLQFIYFFKLFGHILLTCVFPVGSFFFTLGGSMSTSVPCAFHVSFTSGAPGA